MKVFLIGLLVIAGFAGTSAYAASWPGSANAISISSALISADATFEPSGIAWHAGRAQYVVVGDEGQVATMNADGSGVTVWSLGSSYDLEDVTVADANSSYVYVLNENTSSALEFDLATGQLTGKSWSFADRLNEVNGTSGAEGLAWANGAFYVGWQYDGDIYVYQTDLSTSGSQHFVEELHLTKGYTDLSGLAYSTETERLYVLYDGLNILEERDLHGTLLASLSIPGSNQEGIALVPSCENGTATIAIAEDSYAVYRYSAYPISCTVTTPVPIIVPVPEPATVQTVSGTINGDVAVSFSDGMLATYDVFPLITSASTKVRPAFLGTAYTLAYIGRYAALVDPMNGSVFASTVFAKGNIHPLRWASDILGY